MTLEEKLVTDGKPELEEIKKYIIENASETLTEKILSSEKTLESCWKFIYEQARSYLHSQSGYVDPVVVNGWAMHYFEEDDIKVDTSIHPSVKKSETVISNEKAIEEAKKKIEAEFKAELQKKAEEEKQAKIKAKEEAAAKKQAELEAKKKAEEESQHQTSLFDFL